LAKQDGTDIDDELRQSEHFKREGYAFLTFSDPVKAARPSFPHTPEKQSPAISDSAESSRRNSTLLKDPPSSPSTAVREAFDDEMGDPEHLVVHEAFRWESSKILEFLRRATMGNTCPSLTEANVSDLKTLWVHFLEPFR
jgi:hypothetical protein